MKNFTEKIFRINVNIGGSIIRISVLININNFNLEFKEWMLFNVKVFVEERIIIKVVHVNE